MDGFSSHSSVEHVGFFSRIKNAIIGVLFGIGLFLCCVILLFWNEGRSVRTANGLHEAASVLLDVKSDKLDQNNEKKLIATSGLAKTEEMLTDEQFGVSIAALKLVRKVEMYQYRERSESKTTRTSTGGRNKRTEYYYDLNWSESHISSSNFHNSSYVNPPSMKYKSKEIIASEVKLGEFDLPTTLVKKIKKIENLSLQERSAEGLSFPKNWGLRDNYLYLPANLEDNSETPQSQQTTEAQLGDYRISYQFVPETQVSVLAQQVEGALQAKIMSAGYEVHVLYDGELSGAQLIQKEVDLNTGVTWIIRIGGFLVMALGIYLMLRPLEVAVDIIPFLGGIVQFGLLLASALVSGVVSTITIGFAWIFYRPLAGGLLIGLAVLVFVIFGMSKKSKGQVGAIES